MAMPSLVSIIIPCRNEERFIAACLDSLLAQTYPPEKTEIMVIDGMSEDHTPNIVQEYQARYPQLLTLLKNESRFKPFALNIGIKNAKGSLIMIADAHAQYSRTYIETCVHALEQSDVDVVGGKRKATQAKETMRARAIALVFSQGLGVGDATYQIGASTPQYVDTVFGGCYRKELFDEVGLFNENLVRSQDMEMFIRLRRAGKKILLVPDIECAYYPKATLKEFFLHNIQDGIWAIYPLKFVRVPLRIRHYIPLLFIAGLTALGVAGLFSSFWGTIFWSALLLYISIITFISLEIAAEKRDLTLAPALAAAFAARHFGYGIGSLIGVIKLLTPLPKSPPSQG